MVASALSYVIITLDLTAIRLGNSFKDDEGLSSYLVRKRLRIGKWGAAIAALIAFAVVSSASYGLWYAYYRPYTPDEVLLHMHWKPGEVRDVEGIITEVNYFNTTYGREVYLQLKGQWSSMCNGSGLVRGDINKHYVVGERFRTTLHFKNYSLNNLKGVWAEELICPIPIIYQAIEHVFDAVSLVSGFMLAPLERNETGWMSYAVITRDGDKYPLYLVNASLIKGFYDFHEELPSIDVAAAWIVVAALEYVILSGGYAGNPIIDEMHSLEDGTSQNGTMRYVDVNGNGLLDDGDQIRVHLDDVAVQDGFGHQTYVLSLGGALSDCGYICGFKHIMVGAHGPYQLLIPGYNANDHAAMRIRHVGDQVGLNVTSTLEMVQEGYASAIPLSQLNFTLDIKGRDGTIKGNMGDLPVTTADGVSIVYLDTDVNGLLDAGDRFTIGGIDNRTTLTFGIQQIGDGETSLTWIAGYGHIVGNMPYMRFATSDTQMPLTINVSVSWRHPEINLSGHLTMSLWENSTLVLDNVTLVNGSASSFPGGNLTFVDGDSDGFLSSGDYFILHGNPHASYEIEISVLWGYATFSHEFDPS
jgi:hypothetical protein